MFYFILILSRQFEQDEEEGQYLLKFLFMPKQKYKYKKITVHLLGHTGCI